MKKQWTAISTTCQEKKKSSKKDKRSKKKRSKKDKKRDEGKKSRVQFAEALYEPESILKNKDSFNNNNNTVQYGCDNEDKVNGNDSDEISNKEEKMCAIFSSNAPLCG